jgi:hypothetical protein
MLSADIELSMSVLSRQRPGHPDIGGDRDAIVGWVLPAGRYDQRNCDGCNRQQRNQAGGLSPPGLGRLPDLVNEGRDRVAACFIVHWYLLSVLDQSGSKDSTALVVGSLASGDPECRGPTGNQDSFQHW